MHSGQLVFITRCKTCGKYRDDSGATVSPLDYYFEYDKICHCINDVKLFEKIKSSEDIKDIVYNVEEEKKVFLLKKRRQKPNYGNPPIRGLRDIYGKRVK